ncbi:MAG: FecR domain-containing protein [Planctomycetota bacterium]
MSLSEGEFDEILSIYMEGDASEIQLQQLRDAIDSSPKLRQRFQREARLSSLLRETFGEYIELNAIQNSAPPSFSEKRARIRKSLWWLSVAGTALVAVSSVWYLQTRTDIRRGQAMGKCMSLAGSGRLSIERKGEQQQAAQDSTLQEGDRIICGRQSQAMLRLSDGSILAMEPGSELTLVSSRPEIRLEKGEVLFEVAKRKQNAASFQVQTVESTVNVLGTIFALASGDHTELSVYEGEVTLTRHADNAQITVASQQRTTTGDSELQVQELADSGSQARVQVVTLLPTADVTLDRNRIENNSYLKVEGGRRLAYLQFNVPNQGIIRSAALRLTQSVDTGSGELQVHVGERADWAETDVAASILPESRRVAASRSGAVGRGQVIEFELATTLEHGRLTLLLTLDQRGENDIWFASRESDTPPQLLLTLESQ